LPKSRLDYANILIAASDSFRTYRCG